MSAISFNNINDEYKGGKYTACGIPDRTGRR